ncbi:Tim44/TimA family putative adaptor protein [Sphingobium sufflavum]|uniref:Tim44/TimA family putative adaptor protein n=1 Tax=Sphingobium sufflavum TaxID=1129547 RepID=UPI001F1A9158|nr:Tim44/TimA family putative adaptor protein [Sphingobium sufflavum]MCE7795725.1 Tim44/TimA family putative adaptor protein [Sphingobium sufflavum]
MTVIVILAMIFALLALRLYSVLGKRTGHEQQMPAPADDRPAVPLSAARPAVDARPDPVRVGDALMAPDAQGGIRAIIAIDRSFDVTRFLVGARAAYGMILEAFWQGDKDRLRALCDDDVYGAFATAIDDRVTAGHSLENRLVRIDTARIGEAVLNGSTAQITVQFEADIAAVTRDADGVMIAGSLEDAIPTREIWTFARDLRSRSPDWILVATDEV